jgi:hypothetical protein
MGTDGACGLLFCAAKRMSKSHPRRYRRFIFFVLPSPKKGAGSGRGAQQQQQKSAAAAAAAVRARGNEINTAKRDKIGFAPAKLLYSESLTKSTKSFEVNSEPHTGARPSVRLCVGLTSIPISRVGEREGAWATFGDSSCFCIHLCS